MSKKPKIGFLLFSCIGLSTLLFASNTCFASYSYSGKWYVNASAGAAQLSIPGSTTVSNGTSLPSPYGNDTYSINNPNRSATFGLGAGYQWHVARRTLLPYFSLSLQYMHLFSTNINGVDTQFSTPGFNNYTYNMNYYADLFTLNGKADLFKFHSLLPYVALGLGGVINQVENYRETATASVTPRISPNYGDQNSSNFTYTLGAGIDVIVSKTVWLTVGYEHEDLGNVQSGRGTSTWSATNLNFGTFKNNLVFAAISYHFPSSI